MRIVIRVRPRAGSTSVGGDRDGALLVRVREPAEKGRATAAALQAVAMTLGVPERDVRLVSGGTSRTKVIEVDVCRAGGDIERERALQHVLRRLDELMHAGRPSRSSPSSRS